jgi:hypothetical protein
MVDPWAAIASRDSRRIPIASASAIVVLTAGVSIALFQYPDDLEPFGALMLLARNGLCVLVPVWFLFSRGHRTPHPKMSDDLDRRLATAAQLPGAADEPVLTRREK